MATVPEVPVTQLYKHMIDTSEAVHSFTIKGNDKDQSLMWKILMHPGTYIGTTGMIFVVCIGVYIALKDSGSSLPPLGADLIPWSLCNIP